MASASGGTDALVSTVWFGLIGGSVLAGRMNCASTKRMASQITILLPWPFRMLRIRSPVACPSYTERPLPDQKPLFAANAGSDRERRNFVNACDLVFRSFSFAVRHDPFHTASSATAADALNLAYPALSPHLAILVLMALRRA